MLKGLDRVDWQRFAAYAGSWDVDLSSLIRDLISQDAEKREHAREAISQWPYEILSQVGRLGAIPEVLRFMIAILRSPEVGDRAELLRLIVQLVRGADEYSTFRDWYFGDQASFVGSIRQVFAGGLSVYLGCLAEDDPKLRAAAAEALALIPTADTGALLLTQLEREPSQEARQALLGALGKLKVRASLSAVLRFLDSEDLMTRMSAAAAACQVGHPMPGRAFQLLADMAMLGVERQQPRTWEQQLLESNASVKAIMALESLGEEALARAVDRWIAVLPRVEDSSLQDYLLRMVVWTIPQKHEQEKIPGFRLSHFQLKVLQAVFDCSRYWELGGSAKERTHVLKWLHGLPASREGLGILLGEADRSKIR
jgi:HEAT repeat protein